MIQSIGNSFLDMTYQSNSVLGCIDDNEKCSQWKNKDWFKTWCDNRKPHSYFGNMPLASACPSCCDGKKADSKYIKNNDSLTGNSIFFKQFF